MEKFIKGDIVVLPFAFSDLSASKRRPALVSANLNGDDIILCQITSKNVNDKYSVQVSSKDFIEGTIEVESNIRPNRIFTADKNIIIRRIGNVKNDIHGKVVDKIVELIKI